jgi:hypothetical protein
MTEPVDSWRQSVWGMAVPTVSAGSTSRRRHDEGPPAAGGSFVCLVELQRNRRGNCCMIASLSVSDIIRMCSWIES